MNIGLKAVNAKIMICIIALLMPALLVIITQQRLDSFSQYFYTSAGPLFVSVLALTCYIMFGNPKWIPAAICLGTVLMFPCNDWPLTHKIAAVMFFFLSAIAMLFEKQDKIMGIMMLLAGPIALWDIFITEVLLVSMIAVYHMRRLLLIRKILIKKEN
jgi:hypothetical protein